MIYCVAMYSIDGLVLVFDSRTNARIDHIATFHKPLTFGASDERLLVMQTTGSLVTSQSVINPLQQHIRRDSTSLLSVPSVYDATVLTAETTREMMARDGGDPAGNTGPSCSFLVGEQIADGPPALYSICPQGNSIQATPDTPLLQLGESKHSELIPDRNSAFDTPSEQVLHCALVPSDPTIRSNPPVGMSPDLLVYHCDNLILPEGYWITKDNVYPSAIRRQWSIDLHDLLERLPLPPSTYNI